MTKLSISAKDKDDLIKKQYRILGNHGAVEICTWTKKALKNQGVCYKKKFYGVDCHRCAQITPVALWCDQNCTYCWRPMESMTVRKIEKDDVDSAVVILNDVIEKRWNLLNGLPGNELVDKKKLEEAKIPSHYAISLSGEPTLYPYLSEMVKKLRAKPEVRTIFIVTNGQNPENLLEMKKENALPTQLYVSLTSPNEGIFKEINRSVHKDGWARLNKTIEILNELPTRRVLRITLIRYINDTDENALEFAELIKKSGSDFVEIKSYMHIGYSQHRLEKKNMPTHTEVRKFTKKLLERLPGFEFLDEFESSRITLLKNKSSDYANMIKPEEK